MKENIHPKYFKNAKIKCACGAEFTVGSTKEYIEIETCSHCHPFFTGGKIGADRAGAIQKFQEKMAKVEKRRKEKKISSK